MSTPKVTFNTNQSPEFFSTLNTRVNDYFENKNISRYANTAMWIKSIIIILLYIIPWFYLIFGSIENLWMHYILWCLMGLGMVGIGLAIMHDANHGAY